MLCAKAVRDFCVVCVCMIPFVFVFLVTMLFVPAQVIVHDMTNSKSITNINQPRTRLQVLQQEVRRGWRRSVELSHASEIQIDASQPPLGEFDSGLTGV